MFIQRLNYIFLITTVLAAILLGWNWYNNYQFKNNPLSSEIIQQINEKKYRLFALSQQHFKNNNAFPVIVSNKMPSSLYGAATIDKQGNIKIYLNKKRFQENINYMIDSVLPHEYAHAMMFQLGNLTKQNGGHTLKWQKICLKLGGKKCDRFVDNNDVLIEKTNFF